MVNSVMNQRAYVYYVSKLWLLDNIDYNLLSPGIEINFINELS